MSSQIASIPRFSSFTAFQKDDQCDFSIESVDLRELGTLHELSKRMPASCVEPSSSSTIPNSCNALSSINGVNVKSLGLDIESSDFETSCQSRDQMNGVNKFLPFEFECDLTSPCSSDEDEEYGSYEGRVYSRADDSTLSPFVRPRIVRFSSCLVTETYYRPRTTDDEWHHYYYSTHELQSTIDEMRREQQKCVIIAEEEDLDIW
jgi:hypothetical protein